MSDEPPILPDENRPSEPPVVQQTSYFPPQGQHTPYQTPENPLITLHNALDELMGSKSYGAPRVFDLFTLLAITLFFALIFTLLKLIQPALGVSLGNVIMAICSFVTFLALAQSLMFGGAKPRLASIYASPVVFLLTAILMIVINFRYVMAEPGVLVGVFCGVIFSPVCGYLGGGVVAGVFLLADTFRKLIIKESVQDEDESAFEMEGQALPSGPHAADDKHGDDDPFAM